MIYNFCTLFDRNYLYKGLALYNSLIANCVNDFGLWILCMDDITYKLLEKMNLPKVKLIALSDFETSELLKAKIERSVAEYSWTCASNLLWHILQVNKEMELLTYLDADLYFFADPAVLIKELGDEDVLITSHRYSKKYDRAAISGKYCVQFMIFKNNSNGLRVLDWWRQACLTWCFGYLDNGRFGDQKYLDDWLTRFSGIHELEHLGGGVAPWNVSQYNFFKQGGKIWGKEKRTGNNFPLIFYHFHTFCLLSPDKYFPVRGYNLSKDVRELIYTYYFRALQANMELVKKFDEKFDFSFKKISIKERLASWLSRFGSIKFIIMIFKITKNKLYGQKNKS
jgi:hypothetical protein